MAFKFREHIFEDNDFVDPLEINRNFNELAGEFNGKLDRDNFPEAVFTTDYVASETFNKFYTSKALTDYSLTDYSLSWQSGFSDVSFDATHDGIVVCYWSGWWDWSSTVLYDYEPSAGAKTPFIRYRMKVNGILIAGEAFSSAARGAATVQLVGSFPVTPGVVRVSVESRNGKIDTTGKVTVGSPPTLKHRELIVHYRRR